MFYKENEFFKILLLILIVNVVYISQFSFIHTEAVEPDEILQNKKQEIRARNISQNIRCMVCQNQSIDDSDAPLAKDLRLLIRKKIVEGEKDEIIYDYLTERYGDFILLRPPFNLNTLVLWLLPFILFFIGLMYILLQNKKSKKT